MKHLAIAVATLIGLFAVIGEVRAHALQPAYLELQRLPGENWRVFWRKPTVKGRPMAIGVSLPENCKVRKAPKARFDGAAWVAHWMTACPGGLADGVIAIPGLELTQTDALVRYELEQGAGETHRLTSSEPSFTVPSDPGAIDVFMSYFVLGFEHILEGIDHLLFVFALLLLIPDRWRLLGAITAFTLAHSITMAVATLGVITLSGPPVEAVIALSIMFLAHELMQRDGSGTRLSERYPWIVSFSFGLLHGFGFAGALAEIGLPKGDVPLALLSFNLGVEAGQVAFIAVTIAASLVLVRMAPVLIRQIRTSGSAVSIVGGYAIGSLSAYWFIARVAGF